MGKIFYIYAFASNVGFTVSDWVGNMDMLMRGGIEWAGGSGLSVAVNVKAAPAWLEFICK